MKDYKRKNKTSRRRNMDNIVAYGENEDARKDEKDKFFGELQKQIDSGE